MNFLVSKTKIEHMQYIWGRRQWQPTPAAAAVYLGDLGTLTKVKQDERKLVKKVYWQVRCHIGWLEPNPTRKCTSLLSQQRGREAWSFSRSFIGQGPLWEDVDSQALSAHRRHRKSGF